MSFAVAAVTASSGFFKAREHYDTAAILVEPKRFEAQRPSNLGPQDVVTADVTIFATQADLAAGVPTSVNKGMAITGKALTSDLSTMLGQALVVRVEQKPAKKPGFNPTNVWVNASPEAVAKVVAYGEKREAEKAAALASAPDFD